MKKTLKNRNFRSGQSMVEFAVTLTLMLTLLAGAVDLGSAFFSYIAIRDAAGEGALYGSMAAIIDTNANGKYDAGEALNTAAIISRVRSSSDKPVNLNDLTKVTVAVTSTTPPCAGGALTVTVSYNYKIIMPFAGAFLGSQQTIPITASVTDTILKPSCP